jgi:hypothetical protein
MKSYVFLLLLFPLLAFGQSAALGDISRAMNSGDADALGQYFDQTVEVSVLGKEEVFNKNQAIGAVRNFFAQNRPSGFNQVHQGTSPNRDSEYCIGNLNAGGKSYRIYIYMKVDGPRRLIQELRIDRQ